MAFKNKSRRNLYSEENYRNHITSTTLEQSGHRASDTAALGDISTLVVLGLLVSVKAPLLKTDQNVYHVFVLVWFLRYYNCCMIYSIGIVH